VHVDQNLNDKYYNADSNKEDNLSLKNNDKVEEDYVSKDKIINKKSKGHKDKAQKSVKDKGQKTGINKLGSSNSKKDSNDKGDLFEIISMSSNEDKENILFESNSKRIPKSQKSIPSNNKSIISNPTHDKISKNTINNRLIYDNSNESFDFDNPKTTADNKMNKLADIYNEKPKSYDK